MRILQIILPVAITLFFTSCGNVQESDTETVHIDSLTVDSIIADPLVHTIRVKNIGNLRKVFCDLNDTHLVAATQKGINPINDLRSAFGIKGPIQKITTCEYYHVDSLTYSLPYLIPQAANLLADIGKGFSDTIMARGGKKYKIRVTSVLRTEGSVAKLRRVNRNASDSSAHQFGTTFDISYSKFFCCDSSYIIRQEDLKNILGEILNDMRNNGRCFVKYEVKQGCFHITAR